MNKKRAEAEQKKAKYQEWLAQNDAPPGDDGVVVTDMGITRVSLFITYYNLATRVQNDAGSLKALQSRTSIVQDRLNDLSTTAKEKVGAAQTAINAALEPVNAALDERVNKPVKEFTTAARSKGAEYAAAASSTCRFMFSSVCDCTKFSKMTARKRLITKKPPKITISKK